MSSSTTNLNFTYYCRQVKTAEAQPGCLVGLLLAQILEASWQPKPPALLSSWVSVLCGFLSLALKINFLTEHFLKITSMHTSNTSAISPTTPQSNRNSTGSPTEGTGRRNTSRSSPSQSARCSFKAQGSSQHSRAFITWMPHARTNVRRKESLPVAVAGWMTALAGLWLTGQDWDKQHTGPKLAGRESIYITKQSKKNRHLPPRAPSPCWYLASPVFATLGTAVRVLAQESYPLAVCTVAHLSS